MIFMSQILVNDTKISKALAERFDKDILLGLGPSLNEGKSMNWSIV